MLMGVDGNVIFQLPVSDFPFSKFLFIDFQFSQIPISLNEQFVNFQVLKLSNFPISVVLIKNLRNEKLGISFINFEVCINSVKFVPLYKTPKRFAGQRPSGV